MTHTCVLLLLLFSPFVPHYVAASCPKRPESAILRQLRGGQDERPEIHIQVEKQALSEGIQVTTGIPDEHISGRTFFASSAKRTSSRLASNLQQQWVTLRSRALPSVDLATIMEQSSKVWIDSVVPATLFLRDAFWSSGSGETATLTLPAVYALALLGASSGFYMFLYFITIGYALGIMFPLAAAMLIYNSKGKIPALTNLHSGLVIAWAIRTASYFWYREFVNWPQLHEKVVEVNKMAKLSSKLFCWMIYSVFYVLMVIPCLSRFEARSEIQWCTGGKVALGIQAFGLLIEALADYQKSTFKSIPGNRNQWCHVGIWTYSTYPNYLGELLFWYGSYFAGIPAYQTSLQWTLATIGILFITLVMKGAVSSLGAKHMRKYCNNPDFVQFQKSHTMFGPNPMAKSVVNN